MLYFDLAVVLWKRQIGFFVKACFDMLLWYAIELVFGFPSAVCNDTRQSIIGTQELEIFYKAFFITLSTLPFVCRTWKW